jgi:hypothetical protein
LAFDQERLDADEDRAEFAGMRGAALAIGINEAQGTTKRILEGGIAGRIDGQESNFRGTAQKAVVLQKFFSLSIFSREPGRRLRPLAYVDRR